MRNLPYDLIPEPERPAPMGLIVLQVDETIEPELTRAFSDIPAPLYVNRIPSALEVTSESLAAMEARIPAAADLLPDTATYGVIGYGCTSASAIIGSDKVEVLVRQSRDAHAVTNPLRAAIAQAAQFGVSRLALLSPYIEEVNQPLRKAFAEAGLSTDLFGTFGEAEEAKVARISESSIIEAAVALGQGDGADAVFISCTNLRTFDAIPIIQERIGKPVFSSNLALAWHMRDLWERSQEKESPRP